MTKAQKAALPRPLRLRSLLARLNIRHEDIAPSIRQADGKPLSRTSFSQWVNGKKQLVNTPVRSLESQVVAFLLAENVPSADMVNLFEHETENHIFHVAHTTASVFNRDPEIKPVETAVLHQKTKIHFGLSADPFVNDLQDQASVYLNEDSRYILAAMLNWARTAGLGTVVGESGAGKSALREYFILQLRDKHKDIRLVEIKSIDKSKLTAEAVCEAIITDLAPGTKIFRGLEPRARQVEKLLRDSFANNCRHVLLIEEGHDATIELLKYLKRFWEMQTDFRKLLSIILIAQPEIKWKLDERQHPELREFIQRCEVAELMPLDLKVADYLEFKFRCVGADVKKIFAPDAYAAIQQRLTVSAGSDQRARINLLPVTGDPRSRSLAYPLRVGNLVKHAMNEAATAGEKLVSGDVVRGI